MGLKIVEIPTKGTPVKGFPYELLSWQETIDDVRNAESQFIKYKCCADAVIVKSPAGFTIFTTGKHMD